MTLNVLCNSLNELMVLEQQSRYDQPRTINCATFSTHEWTYTGNSGKVLLPKCPCKSEL